MQVARKVKSLKRRTRSDPTGPGPNISTFGPDAEYVDNLYYIPFEPISDASSADSGLDKEGSDFGDDHSGGGAHSLEGIKRQPRLTRSISRRQSFIYWQDAWLLVQEGRRNEVLLTPFAQLLLKLKNIRENVVKLTGAFGDTCVNGEEGTQNQTTRTRKKSRKKSDFETIYEDEDANQEVELEETPAPENVGQNGWKLNSHKDRIFAFDLIKDFDWVIDQLYGIQTQRPIYSMAKTKFKSLLSRELSKYSDNSEMSDYINQTFIDDEPDTDFEFITDSDDGEVTDSFANDDGVSDSTNQKLCVNRNDCFLNDENIRKVIRKITANEFSQPTTEKEEKHAKWQEDEKTKELLRMLREELNSWSFDIFRFGNLTNGWPLTTIGYTIFTTERHLLQNVLKVDEGVLLRFFTSLERKYHDTNPYHNNVHAADVMQTTHILLNSSSLKHVFQDVEVCTALFAAAVHDVDHPGLTNQYLINTSHELAMLYNDNSVLENHHLSTTFKILQDPKQDIFQNLSAKTKQNVRKLSIDMVLATDMSKHMDLIADLKTMVETRKIGSATGSSNSFNNNMMHPDNYVDRVRILKNMLHCADLSNPTKPYHIYEQWSRNITEEFFNQGDLERAKGIDISPMCDRQTVNFENSQLGFIDFVVHPLWEIWNEVVYPEGRYVLEHLAANRMALEKRKRRESLTECRMRRTQSDPVKSSGNEDGDDAADDADDDDDDYSDDADEECNDEEEEDRPKCIKAAGTRGSLLPANRRIGVATQPMIRHPEMITTRRSNAPAAATVAPVDATVASISAMASKTSTTTTTLVSEIEESSGQLESTTNVADKMPTIDGGSSTVDHCGDIDERLEDLRLQ